MKVPKSVDLKPIETMFQGYRFRSRLEARWALFFDTLGLAWEYEKEGYNLDGVWYLPDFWLPKPKLWVEIKGETPTEAEQRKCKALCIASEHDVILWVGDALNLVKESNGDRPVSETIYWGFLPDCLGSSLSLWTIPGFALVDLLNDLGVSRNEWQRAGEAMRAARFDTPDPQTIQMNAATRRQRAIATFAYKKYGKYALEDHDLAVLEEEFDSWLEWKAEHPHLYAE